MMETWILTFYLVGTIPPKPAVDLAGEYQTEDRCMKGGRMQLEHWQKVYGRRIYWKCLPPAQFTPGSDPGTGGARGRQ